MGTLSTTRSTYVKGDLVDDGLDNMVIIKSEMCYTIFNMLNEVDGQFIVDNGSKVLVCLIVEYKRYKTYKFILVSKLMELFTFLRIN
jgi:hypothetical protein